jgi:hypothetical protein
VNKRNTKLLAVGVLLLIALLVIGTALHNRSPEYSHKIVSQDTGEVAYSQPNKTPEKNAGATNTVLFGSYLLLDNGATQAQFEQIKKAFTNYSSSKLAGTYDSLTIIPSTFTAKAGDMKASLRLGQTDKTVNTEIKIWQLKFAQIIVRDPSGQNGGNYDSGQLSASQ